MPFENRAGETALQRRETKMIFAIVLQYELHQPIAQSADAVIKDDGMDFGHVELSQKLEVRMQN